MSGAFEAAAGAFAVVGVADVLVRTGRELYSFLQDITDAPEEITRLRDFILETVLLYRASKRCQNDLNARTASTSPCSAIFSLNTATGALKRELESLERLVVKFKGNKTWSRVKFVLDKAKLNKSISSLERMKALLASALTLACHELSALGDAGIETSVRKSFEQTGLRIEDLLQVHEAKLDAQHQAVLAAHTGCQQALVSKLDAHQQQLSLKQDRHRQILSSVQRMQVDVLDCQDTTTRIVTRTQEQTHNILQTLNLADARAKGVSKVTMDSLDKIATDVKELLSLRNGSDQKQTGRDIFYLGQRQDQIMAYLLPIQEDLDFSIDHVISQQGEGVSTRDVEWLRSEFEHLTHSAAHEKAMQSPYSTATSLDQWSYPKDTVGFLRDSGRHQGTYKSQHLSTPHKDDKYGRLYWLRKRQKRRQQVLSVSTPSGDITISLPDHRTPIGDPQGMDEVGLSYTITQNRSKLEIRARFLREMTTASRPRLCAQLNVFIEVDNHRGFMYMKLLYQTPLSLIDTALRDGVISPFHVNGSGDNLLLLWATACCRLDVLDYLEDQGIGQTSLNHDSTLVRSYGETYWTCFTTENEATFEKALSRAIDTPSFALRVALDVISGGGCSSSLDAFWRLLLLCVRTLQREWFNAAQNEWLKTCCSLQSSTWCSNSVRQLLLLLVKAGAPFHSKDFYGLNYLARFLFGYCWRACNQATRIDILGILIENRVDVNEACKKGLTPSMYARYFDHWDEWCEALERQNMKIDDVLHMEGKTWLLKDGWQRVWRDHQYFLFENLKDEQVSELQDREQESGSKPKEGERYGQDNEAFASNNFPNALASTEETGELLGLERITDTRTPYGSDALTPGQDAHSNSTDCAKQATAPSLSQPHQESN